ARLDPLLLLIERQHQIIDADILNLARPLRGLDQSARDKAMRFLRLGLRLRFGCLGRTDASPGGEVTLGVSYSRKIADALPDILRCACELFVCLFLFRAFLFSRGAILLPDSKTFDVGRLACLARVFSVRVPLQTVSHRLRLSSRKKREEC